MRNGTGTDMKKIISRSRICSFILCLLLSMTAAVLGSCTATDITSESTAEITSEQNRMNTDESRQQAEFVAMVAMDEFKEEFPGDVFGIFAQAGNDIAPVRFRKDDGLIGIIGHKTVEVVTLLHSLNHVFSLRS